MYDLPKNQFLSSEDEDKRFTAGTALGDIVRKLGDRVLPRMVPILKDGLSADDEGQRQGVCRGLVELIAAAGRRNLQKYAEDLISAVKIWRFGSFTSLLFLNIFKTLHII